MKKVHYLLFLCCVTIMLIILGGFYITSPLDTDLYRGDFQRKFLTKRSLTPKTTFGLGYNSFYIAGAMNESIVLGNYRNPFHLLVIKTPAMDTVHVRIDAKEIKKNKETRSYKLLVDSPNFYLIQGTIPSIRRGKIADWKVEDSTADDSVYFVEAIPTGKNSFAFRSYSMNTKMYQLGKKIVDHRYLEYKHDLLEKQIDGLFCVDGKLHLDKSTNKLIYLYSYRNQFLVMDTSLNLINRFNTLDTFSHAPIQVSYVEDKNFATVTAPPYLVNINSAVYNNHIFVISNILSRNEQEEQFRKNSVIDVFDLTTGAYSYSFYIKHKDGKALSEFQIYNDQVIVLVDRSLMLYDLKAEQPDVNWFKKGSQKGN